MSDRKMKRLRVMSVVLLLSIINQIAFPTVAVALTSGPTQPEIYGYQPVDATDNVNLGTGGFNYTIPITSIPEFPMAIGYNAGLGMDHEASAFGFGFNGFSGAITRNVNGLPDDIKGAKRIIKYSNQIHKDISYSSGATWGINLGGGIAAGARLGHSSGYNNYTGSYGSVGIGTGVGASVGDKATGSGGIGVQLTVDSREKTGRFTASASLGLGMSSGADNGNVNVNTGLSMGIYASKPINGGAGWETGGSLGTKQFKFGAEENKPKQGTTLAPLAYIMPNTVSKGGYFGVAFMFYGTSIDIGATWSKDIWAPRVIKRGYGFMYLNRYNRASDLNMADVGIEGENSFKVTHSVCHLQKDNYSVNTMGLAGGLELYQPTYGVVSRNAYKKYKNSKRLLLKSVSTEEIHPWVATQQQSLNKSADILVLLKSPDAILEGLFNTKDLVDLNTRQNRFKSEAVFKMRGDFAGQYDLASNDFQDHNVNTFRMEPKETSTRDVRMLFLGIEMKLPLKYPAPNRDYASYIGNNQDQKLNINRGTNIVKKTISEMLGAAANGGWDTKDPNAGDADAFLFNQSFYSHNHYKGSNSGNRALPVVLNDDVEKMNILNHLKVLKAHEEDNKNNNSFGDLIGSMEMQSTNGLRYFFNLPAFSKSTSGLSLKGGGNDAPINSGGEYRSLVDSKEGVVDRNRTETEEDYAYPYAWLLTAIVGDDYIDFDNVPGPSDGDIGYWVKFKYTLAADDYRWRFPFTGLDHVAGAIDLQDDVYSMSTGTKEVYYLSEVESSNYQCKYQYQKRFDGFDANGSWNGSAKNSLTQTPYNPSDPCGYNVQFAVTQIDLYKKHNSAANSETIRLTQLAPIKSTKFYYDYSTSSNVPNNYITSNGGLDATVKGLPYYYTPPTENLPTTTGKLTLRKVQHIAYDQTGETSTASLLPSYTFNYYGDYDAEENPFYSKGYPVYEVGSPDYNPTYDRKTLDRWGNYSRFSADTYTKRSSNELPDDFPLEMTYYHHYTEYIKEIADENAKAFKLKFINLPSGGKMEVEYEAQSYAYVEDKTPYVMRHVKRAELNNFKSVLTVDVTDLAVDGKNLLTATTTDALGSQKRVLEVGGTVYGELAFDRRSKFGVEGHNHPRYTTSINEEATVFAIDPTVTVEDGRSYQKVTLETLSDEADYNDTHDGAPFYLRLMLQMYFNSEEAQALADKSGDCDKVHEYIPYVENAMKDNIGSATRKLFSHFAKMFTSFEHKRDRYNECFGNPKEALLYSHWSFLRTNAYKAKYTGAVVKSVKLTDGFSANNATNGKPDEEAYGTVYHYDLGDGTGTSAGVATNEPGGGLASVLNNNRIQGRGFTAAPAVMNSRITMENLYHEKEKSTTPNASVVSREKGKTVYNFHTPKEEDLRFNKNFKKWQNHRTIGPLQGSFTMFGVFTWLKLGPLPLTNKIYIKVPFIVLMLLNWRMRDYYFARAYSYTDQTDMYGKLKGIEQFDATGKAIGSQNYTYYGVDEPVPVYNKTTGFSMTDAKVLKPGKVDEVWSESFYTRKDDINRIGKNLMFAITTKKFEHTTMKYSYIPAVLKKVESNIDGLISTTQYTGFDYYTGQPIEVRSKDSYGYAKISQTIPAYWEYEHMGPSSARSSSSNNLTASTGTYMYLKDGAGWNEKVNYYDDAEDLIGVGVVEWADIHDKKWKVVSYLQPKQNKVSFSQINYTYAEKNADDIKDKYTSAAPDFPYIKGKANLYKPYKGYTYEVSLDGDGRFTSFIPFTYGIGTANTTWKELSTNELYTQNGVLVQSKDVLSKYAAQLLGYNFSNTIGAVSNASLAACAYDGAENTYETATGFKMLEANKVELKDARVEKMCLVNSYMPKEFVCDELIENNKVITVTVPDNVVYNKPFARIYAVYPNTSNVFRSLFLSMNDNNEIEITSNKGSVFNGYLTYPKTAKETQLFFNSEDFTYFYLDANYTNNDFVVTSDTDLDLPDCECITKDYLLPNYSCEIFAHTGSYAFVLDPYTAKGTEYTLHTNTAEEGYVTTAEFRRKYKALVWVHNSSPHETELVVQLTNSSGQQVAPELKTSKATPYAVAGDWSLLRLDFDLSDVAPSGKSANIFIRNKCPIYMWRSNYDDFRVLPYHADMTNWVYDHKFNRVVSGLDVDHFASYSFYDNRGRVTKSAVEVQHDGKTIVQKFLYNDQKPLTD